MKIRLLIGLLLCAYGNHSLHAQNWEWLTTLNNSHKDAGTSIGVDSDDNIYITGYDKWLGASSDPDNHHYEHIYKFSPAGTLIWRDTLGIYLTKSVTDPDGNTYVTGSSSIIKYDNAGSRLWTKFVLNGYFKNIALHPEGGVVVIGINYPGSAPDFGNIVLSGNSQWFIARIDAASNCLWAKESNNFWNTAVTVGPDGKTYSSGAGGDSTGRFHIKIYDQNGDSVGVMAHNIVHYSEDIAIDKQGSVFITGIIPKVSSLGPLILGTDTIFCNCKNSASYIVKYDSLGQILWYKIIRDAQVNTIMTDEYNSLYAAGSYRDTITVDSITVANAIDGKYSSFVCKFDSAGSVKWIKHSESTQYDDGGSAIVDMVLTSTNDLFVTGSITDEQTFDSHTVTVSSLPDLLLGKIGNDTLDQAYTAVIEEVFDDHLLTVYPNPTDQIVHFTYSSNRKDAISLTIRNIHGQVIRSESYSAADGRISESIDLGEAAKGVYFLEIMNEKERLVKKLVLQ